MRLLRLHDDNTFSLTEFHGDDIPLYAILSHTWGADNEEVTFRDIVESPGIKRQKLGYAKLHLCARQAARDRLTYFWVDTCCIDKSSSAELSEAINSMYCWYRNAANFYVYLADVSILDYRNDSACLRRSRWFSRGWTLQELLAPSYVDFFTVNFTHIGCRDALLVNIIQATGLPVEVFMGLPLHHSTIAERLRWAEARNTKREEGAAYSLLGILDIYVSPIYGEGRERAMFRTLHEAESYE